MISNFIRFITLGLTGLSLGACVSDGYAPVVRLTTGPRPAPKTYIVRKGDTLYSLSWQYGLDYHQIARVNRLNKQFDIYPGQKLALKVMHNRPRPQVKISSYKKWVWPTKGHIVQTFTSGFGGNAGIDIAGRYGQEVIAAQAGTVVYSGQGVRGYGNLIIMNNSDHFLSAYAFNRSNKVRVGQRIKQGQPIAEMGRDSSGRVVLHFEIRKDGQPVNPLNFLK